MRWGLLGIAALASACKVAATFECATDPQCGAGGTCETTGYCSFADPSCPSGQRYDDYAGGELAGACTDPFAPDARPADADPATPDAMSPIDAFPPLELRINNGGAAFTGTDYPGMWSADVVTLCPGATPFSASGAINGTVDDELFINLTRQQTTLTCAVPSLPPGGYRVRLLFAEIYYQCAGGPANPRVVDVTVEGTLVRDDLSSAVDGGGCALQGGHPYEVVVNATITDGQLDIVVAGSMGSGMLSALEVVRVQ
jgi:hypothetical protein